MPDTTPDFLSQRLAFEEFLKTHEIRVTFKKATGETRELRCTRNPEMFKHLLPVKPQVDTDNPKPYKQASDKQVRVWDLDKNGWRSFNIDTVVEWKLVGGPDEEAPLLNEARWNGVATDDEYILPNPSDLNS